MHCYLPELIPNQSSSSNEPSLSFSSSSSEYSPETQTAESLASSGNQQSSATLSTHNEMSPRSHLNPYYGYPVTYTETAGPNQVPHLIAGRRRKRDLIKTLIVLLIRRLTVAIPNLFLQASHHRHRTGTSPISHKRKLRPWIWWTLLIWIAASLRKITRIRNGALLNGITSVDGKLQGLSLSLLVGGEFLRRSWIATSAVAQQLTAPLLI